MSFQDEFKARRDLDGEQRSPPSKEPANEAHLESSLE
jgi:hypothetical protein